MNEFKNLIQEKSDNELLALYVLRGEYEPEYVAFLLEEITARDLFKDKLGIDEPSMLTEIEMVKTINHYITQEQTKESPKPIKENIHWARASNYAIDMIFLLVMFLIIGINADLDKYSLITLDLIFMFIYYLLLEGITGKTIGKYLTDTHVVTLDGRRPTFGRIIIRTFARFIPFDGISFIFYEDWHDKLSGTKVVSDE